MKAQIYSKQKSSNKSSPGNYSSRVQQKISEQVSLSKKSMKDLNSLEACNLTQDYQNVAWDKLKGRQAQSRETTKIMSGQISPISSKSKKSSVVPHEKLTFKYQKQRKGSMVDFSSSIYEETLRDLNSQKTQKHVETSKLKPEYGKAESKKPKKKHFSSHNEPKKPKCANQILNFKQSQKEMHPSSSLYEITEKEYQSMKSHKSSMHKKSISDFDCESSNQSYKQYCSNSNLSQTQKHDLDKVKGNRLNFLSMRGSDIETQDNILTERRRGYFYMDFDKELQLIHDKQSRREQQLIEEFTKLKCFARQVIQNNRMVENSQIQNAGQGNLNLYQTAQILGGQRQILTDSENNFKANRHAQHSHKGARNFSLKTSYLDNSASYKTIRVDEILGEKSLDIRDYSSKGAQNIEEQKFQKARVSSYCSNEYPKRVVVNIIDQESPRENSDQQQDLELLHPSTIKNIQSNENGFKGDSVFSSSHFKNIENFQVDRNKIQGFLETLQTIEEKGSNFSDLTQLQQELCYYRDQISNVNRASQQNSVQKERLNSSIAQINLNAKVISVLDNIIQKLDNQNQSSQHLNFHSNFLEENIKDSSMQGSKLLHYTGNSPQFNLDDSNSSINPNVDTSMQSARSKAPKHQKFQKSGFQVKHSKDGKENAYSVGVIDFIVNSTDERPCSNALNINQDIKQLRALLGQMAQQYGHKLDLNRNPYLDSQNLIKALEEGNSGQQCRIL